MKQSRGRIALPGSPAHTNDELGVRSRFARTAFTRTQPQSSARLAISMMRKKNILRGANAPPIHGTRREKRQRYEIGSAVFGCRFAHSRSVKSAGRNADRGNQFDHRRTRSFRLRLRSGRINGYGLFKQAPAFSWSDTTCSRAWPQTFWHWRRWSKRECAHSRPCAASWATRQSLRGARES